MSDKYCQVYIWINEWGQLSAVLLEVAQNFQVVKH